jgi:hypothetical protein
MVGKPEVIRSCHHEISNAEAALLRSNFRFARDPATTESWNTIPNGTLSQLAAFAGAKGIWLCKATSIQLPFRFI